MKEREILFVVVSIFALVLLYIGFNIYHNSVTSTIPQALSIQVAPIAPSFDQKTIDSVKKREKVSPDFQAPIATPSPTGTPFAAPPISPTSISTRSGQTKIP